MKKVLSLLLSLLLLMSCALCTATAEAEPYTVTMMFLGTGQDAEAEIEAAINELTLRDLNMKLDIMVVPYGSFVQQVQLMLSGGEKLDLMPATPALAASYIASKAVYDLNDYIDADGGNIVANMGSGVRVASMNGFVYGIPVVCDWYRQASVLVRTDWLTEAGFTKEDVGSIENLEKVYAAVKANHPDASMLALSKNQSYDAGWYCADPLGDGYGVLLNYGAEAKVENWYASDAYKTLLERQYRWCQNGWISRDAATTTDIPNTQVANGLAFSMMATNQPAIETETSTMINIPMTLIPLLDAYTTSTYTTAVCWSIARTGAQPEKAFQMLNYIYGSAEVANLLNWGVEGEHYVVTEDGHAAFPEGSDKTNDPYNQYFGYQLPNQYISYPWMGVPADVGEKVIAANQSALRSAAYGFAFDSSSVANELAALDNVKSQYLDALNTGSVNPDDVLPQFLEDLKNAGMDTVIAEKQAQLDAWLAQQ